MEEKFIYIASPLGFSETGRDFMYKQMLPRISELGYGIKDPWVLTDARQIEQVMQMPYGTERKEAWTALNKIIGANNREAIEQSIGVVAVLDGVDVDSGTAAEIGYASALHKPVLGYRGDFRLASDNEGSIVNLQVEYFIRSHGGTIVRTLDELVQWLPKVMG